MSMSCCCVSLDPTGLRDQQVPCDLCTQHSWQSTPLANASPYGPSCKCKDFIIGQSLPQRFDGDPITPFCSLASSSQRLWASLVNTWPRLYGYYKMRLNPCRWNWMSWNFPQCHGAPFPSSSGHKANWTWHRPRCCAARRPKSFHLVWSRTCLRHGASGALTWRSLSRKTLPWHQCHPFQKYLCDMRACECCR